MIRSTLLIALLLCLSGCMAVLGYEPTPSELEAIRRGEDPRAGEAERNAERNAARESTRGNAGESTSNEPGKPAKPREPGYSTDETPGPSEGVVLRWVDSATVEIEVGLDRETVTLHGVKPLENSFDEQAALDDRMNRWTYGSFVRLTYPLRTEQGKTIYRDDRGRLIASID
jgi:hypothetical protein